MLAGASALGVGAYRQRQEARIVALSVARAQRLVRSDTWLGYGEAATLLGLRAARADPPGAGSLRALALAMLALDYRDDQAAAAADAALQEVARRGPATETAHLAWAVLALREGRFGTAAEQLASGGDGPLRHLLTARAALLAGHVAGAAEPVRLALAADPRLPAALALRGDLLRRAGRATEARDAYLPALRESSDALATGLERDPGHRVPPHARASFGLAKLALSSEVPSGEASAPLGSMLDRETPPVERIRAALYLAALQARLGDGTAAATTLRDLPADAAQRAWVERASAALAVARERFRVPAATPASLVSASDDDPYVPPPPPPPPQPARPVRTLPWGFKVSGPGTHAAAAGPKARPKSKGKGKVDKAKPRPRPKAKAKAVHGEPHVSGKATTPGGPQPWARDSAAGGSAPPREPLSTP